MAELENPLEIAKNVFFKNRAIGKNLTRLGNMKHTFYFRPEHYMYCNIRSYSEEFTHATQPTQ